MDQNYDKLYPSAPLLENIDLEKRSEKKLMLTVVLTTSTISKK